MSHTLAQNQAEYIVDLVTPMNAEDRTAQMALLIKNFASLKPEKIEGMLIAFAGLGISSEDRAHAINATFDRLDAVTNTWSFDSTLEAARRLTFGSQSLTEAFQQRAAAYAEAATPDRARIVQGVIDGRAHATRWYPKAA